jgi:hypothetical protein
MARRDAVQELFDIQAGCQAWLDNLPPALADSPIVEHLREVCELDLSPFDAVLPPKGGTNAGRGVVSSRPRRL